MVKKAAPKEREDETTKHSSLGRRIGRWIAKKVSKEKKDGHIPTEPLKPISATLCPPIDEPSSLQILCEEAVDATEPGESTKASLNAEKCIKTESMDVTADDKVNLETIRNTVVSMLTELFAAAVDKANSTNADIKGSKEELVNEETHSKDHMAEQNNNDKKPEYNQINVMSLKEMCKSAVTNSDYLKRNIDDRQTYHIESEEINGHELDKTSLSSEMDEIVTRILSEICRKVISHADSLKTMTDIAKNQENNAELNTRDVYPENNTRKVMSLKDLCTAAIKTTVTIGEANTEKHPVDDDIDSVKCHRARILSLMELCAAAIRNACVLNCEDSDHDAAALVNNKLCKAFDSKTNMTEKNPESDEMTKKSSIEFWPVTGEYTEDMIVSINDSEMDQRYDKNHENSTEIEPDDYEIKPKSSDASVNTLKEICLEFIIHNKDEKFGMVKTVNTVECHTGTQSSDSDGYQVESIDVKPENHDINPTSAGSSVTSLKQLCTTAIGDAREGKEGTKRNETVQNYHKANDVKNDNKNEKPCTDPEKSLKEVCTIATRQSDEATVRMFVTEQDQTRDKYETDFCDSKPYYSVINLKSEQASAQSLLEMYYNAIGNADEVTAGKTDIEEDYVFVDIPEYINSEGQCLANNFEIEQNDDKSQTEYICEVRSTACNNDNSDPNVTGTAADSEFSENYEKSLEFETDNRCSYPLSDKVSIQSQVKQCLEEVITACKAEDEIHEKQAKEICNYKTFVNPKYDQSKKESRLTDLPTKLEDPNDEKAGIIYPQKGRACRKHVETEAGVNYIIPGNEKAIGIYNIVFSSAGATNGYGKRTSRSDTKQNKASCVKESSKFETDVNGTLSGFEYGSPDAVDEICTKTVISIDDKEENNTKEGQAPDKTHGTKADTTENLRKSYFLTRALMSLMQMSDKETRQNEDGDPEENFANESDTKKVCGKTLLHLATNLNKLSEATVNKPVKSAWSTTNDNIQQELAVETQQKQPSCKSAKHPTDLSTDLGFSTENHQRYFKAKQNSEYVTDPFYETKYFHTNYGMPEWDTAIRTDSVSKPRRSYSDEITYQRNYGDIVEIAVEANNKDHGTALIPSESNHDSDKNTARKEKHVPFACSCKTSKNNKSAKNADTDWKEGHADNLQDAWKKQSAQMTKSVESLHGQSRNIEKQEQSSDTDAYYTPETSSSHIDENCQIQNKITYSDKPDKVSYELDTDRENHGVDSNADGAAAITATCFHNDNTNLEREKHYIGDEVTYKSNGQKQVQDPKTVEIRGRNTKRDEMIAKINETVNGARAMALGTENVYGSDSKKDNNKPWFASEADNQELLLPIETIFRLMVDTYNERKESKKKKLRSEVRLHCDIDYQINMDENIANAEQLTENEDAFTNHGLTLTDSEDTITIISEGTARRRKQSKSREVGSNGDRNADVDRQTDNKGNHSVQQIPEPVSGAMPVPNSENIEDENMILPSGWYFLFFI